MAESYKPKRLTTQHIRDPPSHPLDMREVRTQNTINPMNTSHIVRSSEHNVPSLHFSHGMLGTQNTQPQKAYSQRLEAGEQRDEPNPLPNPRNLYEQKQRSYKKQIQQLQDRYETLKLKHKQALMSISHLHGKLKMFLSEDQINSDAIKLVAEETEKSYREVYQTLRNRTENLIARHQVPIRTLLEQYGCTYEESSLQGFKTEAEIIQMLVGKFSEKADVLRQYEAQTSEKLARSRQEFLELQDSIKYIVETNELYKIREAKYKEKMDEVKQEWQQVCEKLARKDLDSQQWENQNYTLKQRIQELEFELSKFEMNSDSKQESESAEVRALQSQLADMTNRVSEIHLKYQHLYAAYQEAQLTIEELTIKDKMREGEFERVSREAVRWKERYDWLERERYQSLQIIESENNKLRDEVLRQKRQGRPQYEPQLQSISEQERSADYMTHQYSLRPSNNVDEDGQHGRNELENSKPVFGRYVEPDPKSNEQSALSYEDQPERYTHKHEKNRAQKPAKRYTEQQVPSEQLYTLTSPSNSVPRRLKPGESSGVDGRMKRIEDQMSRRGIKAGPADQRLQQLLKEFEGKLWKMQDNSLPTQ